MLARGVYTSTRASRMPKIPLGLAFTSPRVVEVDIYIHQERTELRQSPRRIEWQSSHDSCELRQWHQTRRTRLLRTMEDTGLAERESRSCLKAIARACS